MASLAYFVALALLCGACKGHPIADTDRHSHDPLFDALRDLFVWDGSWDAGSGDFGGDFNPFHGPSQQPINEVSAEPTDQTPTEPVLNHERPSVDVPRVQGEPTPGDGHPPSSDPNCPVRTGEVNFGEVCYAFRPGSYCFQRGHDHGMEIAHQRHRDAQFHDDVQRVCIYEQRLMPGMCECADSEPGRCSEMYGAACIEAAQRSAVSVPSLPNAQRMNCTRMPNANEDVDRFCYGLSETSWCFHRGYRYGLSLREQSFPDPAEVDFRCHEEPSFPHDCHCVQLSPYQCHESYIVGCRAAAPQPGDTLAHPMPEEPTADLTVEPSQDPTMGFPVEPSEEPVVIICPSGLEPCRRECAAEHCPLSCCGPNESIRELHPTTESPMEQQVGEHTTERPTEQTCPEGLEPCPRQATMTCCEPHELEPPTEHPCPPGAEPCPGQCSGGHCEMTCCEHADVHRPTQPPTEHVHNDDVHGEQHPTEELPTTEHPLQLTEGPPPCPPGSEPCPGQCIEGHCEMTCCEHATQPPTEHVHNDDVHGEEHPTKELPGTEHPVDLIDGSGQCPLGLEPCSGRCSDDGHCEMTCCEQVPHDEERCPEGLEPCQRPCLDQHEELCPACCEPHEFRHDEDPTVTESPMQHLTNMCPPGLRQCPVPCTAAVCPTTCCSSEYELPFLTLGHPDEVRPTGEPRGGITGDPELCPPGLEPCPGPCMEQPCPVSCCTVYPSPEHHHEPPQNPTPGHPDEPPQQPSMDTTHCPVPGRDYEESCYAFDDRGWCFKRGLEYGMGLRRTATPDTNFEMMCQHDTLPRTCHCAQHDVVQCYDSYRQACAMAASGFGVHGPVGGEMPHDDPVLITIE